MHAGNNAVPRHSTALEEYAAARNGPGTSFPSLTGRSHPAHHGQAVTATYQSTLFSFQLQDAARRHQVSPVSIPMLAWAKVLELYTAIEDDVVFHYLLPGGSNLNAHDSCPSSPIIYTYRAQQQSQVALRHLLSQLNRQLSSEQSAQGPRSSPDGPSGKNHQDGTLLNLENLQDSSASCGLFTDDSCGLATYAATLRIDSPQVTSAPLSLTVSGRVDLIDAEAAQLLLAQYDHILEAMIRYPDEPIDHVLHRLPCTLLSISNPQPVVPNVSSSLQSQFEEVARSDPERVALEFWTSQKGRSLEPDTVCTYAELDSRAEKIAAELQLRFGSLAGHVVPVCMDRCPEIYAAILGILKAGAAWCPIDPSFPPLRRRELITRTAARVLVVNIQSPPDGVPEHVTAFDLTRLEGSPPKQSSRVEVSPDSLAYLIWTSGTTGAPKGVPISHRAATASMRALQVGIPTNVKRGRVRCLQFSQFTFDVFVQDLFYTWGVGGTLISADRVIMLGSFAELATESEATHAHLTPAFAASVPRKRCPTLEVITMIGEKLTPNVASDWSEDCRLYNTYGPAEATIVATFRLVSHGDVVQSANIGLPLPSVSAFVIHDGEIMLRNGIGELALGGAQLATGYWKDSAKTGERFVWNERLQTILYMTGDVVRQLQDGTFEFVGRIDDLIKIQGIRVELSEIAYALRSCHPEVRQVEVAFLNRQDRPSKVIVAFLAAATPVGYGPGIIEDDHGVEVARATLEMAKTQLPAYMIPKVFLVVDAIPRTSSAKIDRVAIQRLYATMDLGAWEKKLGSTGRDGMPVADLDPREVMIVEIISALTGTSKQAMSRHSTLPSLGVDSITATRLVPRLRGQAAAVSIGDILQCSTLDDLFHLSRRERENTGGRIFDLSAFHHDVIGSLAPHLAIGVELAMPTLPLQESLLSESFQNPNSYWSHDLFELDANLNLGKLEKAWKDVTQCTEALRTSFCAVADGAQELEIASPFLQLLRTDVWIDWATKSTTDDDFEVVAKQRAQEIAQRRQEQRFAQPLWAVTLFRLMSSRTLMMVSTHHAIRDDQSLHTIMTDLQRVYVHGDTQLMQQRNQLRDAVSLLYTLDAGQIERDENFWSQSLSGFNDGDESRSWPELKLADDGRSEGTVTYCWNAADSYNDLRIKAASIGAASLAAVLRVVWGCILLEYLESDKVVFGETWSARGDVPGLSDTVAPLVYVLPVPFQAQTSWREMLQRTSDFQRQSKLHRGLHPRSIRKIMCRFDDEALYPAIFNFVPDSAEQRQEDHAALWREVDDVVGLSVEHAIAFSTIVSNQDTLRFELTARKQSTDREHLHILRCQIDAFLNTILNDPDGLLSQLPRQMPQTCVSVASSRITSATNLAWQQPPTEWVDQHAALHPNWTAAEVVQSFDEKDVISQKWSYEQLQKAYRNVAAVISESGCRQRMIAVCLDRRLEVFAVILGIMSSGNTYLPIADDLPEERKSFLLQDSNAALLLTTRSLVMTSPPTCRTILVEDLDYSESIPLSPDIRPLPAENSYLLYTSGSTGSPKGVLVSRGNLTSFIEAISHFIRSHVDMEQLQGKGKWLGMASYAFDVHLLEMFFAWRHGMATVTAARLMLLDNLELALQKLKVTHASFVPSLVDNAGLDPATLPDLRYMSLGGEKISKKAIDAWSRGHVVLANAYGPTEATIGCCFRRVEPTSNVRNIGYPLSYTVAHVLRPGMTEYVLRGTSGELCVTGDLVATGYYNRPDAKGFVEDFRGQRMYRTGDKVRLMADGSLEFLGREDDQTKIRGQRIELGEVCEAVRAAAKEVLGVAVTELASLVAQHQSLNRPRLVTFLAVQDSSRSIPNGNLTITDFPSGHTVERIRAYCRSTLPSFMVPDHLIRLTSLPLVPTSRKVDTKQLLKIFNDSSLDGLTASSEPPRSNTKVLDEFELAVRTEVAEVLSVEEDKLYADSNLFQLGLDSLNVISLTIKLQRRFFNSSVSKILQSPTIRGIASGLTWRTATCTPAYTQNRHADLERRFKEKSNSGLDLSNVAGVIPCLPLQETLVASSLDREGEALYVNHMILELSAGLDHQRFLKAWNTTAGAHEILRTCFPEFENHFVQLILARAPLSCNLIHIDAGDDGFPHLQQSRSDIAFDIVDNLETKPPIRLTLVKSRLRGEKAMLLVSLHHALYDKESFSMLLDEVYAEYQRRLSKPYYGSVTALINYMEAVDRSDATRFWRRYLAGYRPVPAGGPAVDSKSTLTSRKLSTPLSEIERLAASMNSTPASVMQAIFGVILAEVIHTNDVVFGVVLSGRTIPVEHAHRIVFPCITTIPQRVRMDGASKLEDIVLCAQEGFVESIEYQHTALRDIHRWVEAESPLFDTLFTYTWKVLEAEWSHLWKETESSMLSGFPLAVEIVADHETNCFTANCEYTPAFGTVDQADGLLERLGDLIQCLVQGQAVTLKTASLRGDVTPVSHGSCETSWTEDQLLMRNIVSQMVGLDEKNISADTSFFTLGIDSVIAIQLGKRLRRHGMQCSSADIMRYSTIKTLSGQITAHSSPAPHANRSIEHVQPSATSLNGSMNERLTTFACTPLQSSMLTQTLGSDTPLYVHHHAFRLLDEDGTANMRRAWEKLVASTQILRTGFRFSKTTKSWKGVVYNKTPTLWTEHGTSVGLEQTVSQVKVKMGFQEENDFRRPPWRVDLARNVFILSMHHSLYDGESIGLLFRDLWALSKGSPLPTRPSFSQAAEEMHSSTGEATEYWIQSLSDFKGNPAEPPSEVFREIKLTLQADVTALVKDCHSLGVTLQSAALLAFGKTVAWLSRQKDVVFGHVVRGRSLPNLEADEVIGPLFNTVPVRVKLESTTATNGSATQAIQNVTGESQAYQHAPLNQVQQAWRQQIGDLDADLIGSLFVFQRRVSGEEVVPPWEHVAVDENAAPTEYATNFECEQTDSGIDVSVNSRSIGDLESLVKTFEQVLIDILRHPDNHATAVWHDLAPFAGAAAPNHKSKSKAHNTTDQDFAANIMDIVRNVLAKASGIAVDRIANDASLFSLGFDSISAIQIASAARKEGLKLSVADVLQGRTLNGICHRLVPKQDQSVTAIDQMNGSTSPPSHQPAQVAMTSHTPQGAESKILALAGLRDADVEEILPCLPGQYYHLMTWLKSGRTLGEGTFTYVCADGIDPDRFLNAWRGVRERHAILRTVFVATSAVAVEQVVLKPAAIRSDAFQCIDYTPGALRDVVRQTACRRFDLYAPPVELVVARSGDVHDTVILKLHHALYDAWTIGKIVQDLSALYEERNLRPVPSSSALVYEIVHSAPTQSSQRYWYDALAGCQQTILSSTLSPLPPGKRTHFFTQTTIPNLDHLEAACQLSSTSLPTAILVAFARALAHSTDVPNPSFGLYQTGRSSSTDVLAAGSCLPCLNMTPLMVRAALTQDARSCMEAVQANLADRVPFEQNYMQEILESVGWGRKTLFNTFVNILWGSWPRGSCGDAARLLTPWEDANLKDLAPSQRVPGRTGVDGLDTGVLAGENLFLDVLRCRDENEMRLVVRCDGGVLSLEEAQRFLDRVGEEMGKCVESDIGGGRGSVAGNGS
ncbi:MAG: hypothetical protein Q9173_003401 [Seirophora scorigena]